ncbi:MAG: metallophosphoesterase [Acidobacteriota bacterium]
MPWALRMTLMLTLVGSVLHFYVWRKIANSTAELSGWQKKRVGWMVALVALWCIAYPVLGAIGYSFKFTNLLGLIQRPGGWTNILLIYPFWLGLIFAAQLAMGFLLIDFADLFLSRIDSYRKSWMKYRVWLALGLSCIVIVYVVVRVYRDTWTVRTRERIVEIANLPAELENFRIIHIADLQAANETNGSKLQNYVDVVNRLKGDVIFFSGDVVTSGTEFVEAGAQAMGKMTATHGIYAVVGDHDLFGDKALVKRKLQENGINVLDNLAAIIPVQASALSITGVTNAYRERPSQATLATIESQRLKGAVNIFLIHQPSPDLVDFAKSKGYDLFLAGHTHGGQIVFPLPGFLLTGSSFETPYVTGFYQVDKMLVSVNNGLGLTLAPIRYHAPAEVTLIRLKRANDSQN